jgi:hypothetical protein
MQQHSKMIAYILVFILHLHGLEAAGDDGQIQTPNTGQYCTNYFDSSSFTHNLLIDDCQNCDG